MDDLRSQEYSIIKCMLVDYYKQYRRSGLRIPWPMMKWSFSRFDIIRSSSRTLPLAVYPSPPSRSFVDTCSVSFDFFFSVIDTNLFFFIVAFDSRGVNGDSFSCTADDDFTATTSTVQKSWQPMSTYCYPCLGLHRTSAQVWQTCQTLWRTSPGGVLAIPRPIISVSRTCLEYD